MKGKRNKRAALLIMLGFLAVGIIGMPGRAEAGNKVYNLKEKKTYSFNLDKKGGKEKISYSVNMKNGVYTITINGKAVKKINLTKAAHISSDEINEGKMQVFDINKKDNHLDIWVYMYGYSHDVCYSALYQYSHKKIEKVWELTGESDLDNAQYGKMGYILSTNGKGKFTVIADRLADCAHVTGNHFDKVEYRLKKGKVTQVSGRTLSFYKYRVTLKAGRTLKFYTSPNKGSTTFTVGAGSKCVPQKVYIESKNVEYVQFKMKNGKKGWLCTDEYSYSSLPFSNMPMFD